MFPASAGVFFTTSAAWEALNLTRWDLTRIYVGGSDGKESACSAGNLGLIPGLGRSPGEGHGYPFQYSCLENPHGQRSLAGYSPWGRKESDTTEQLSTAHLQNTQPLPTTVIGTCWTLSHRCLSPGPLLSPHKSPPFALVSVLSRAAKGTLFKLKLDHVSSLPRTSRAVLS